MIESRSGAPPRVLFFSRRYDSLFTKLISNGLGYALLIGVFLGLCYGGASALEILFDFDHPLYRLDAPLSREEVAAGGIRASGRVGALKPSTVPPLCLVIHQYYKSGKNSGWREDWRGVFNSGTLIRATSGATLTLNSNVVRFDPEEPVVSTRDSVWRKAAARDFTSGRFLEACLQEGEPVFVSGCVDQETRSTLVPCPPERSVVVTTGDGSPQRRIDRIAADVVLRLSALFAAALMVLIWLAKVVKARPLANALINRFAHSSSNRTWLAGTLMIVIPLLLGSGWGFASCNAAPKSDFAVSRFGFVVGLVTLGACGLIALLAYGRRSRLWKATKPIEDLPTIPLARAEGNLVEIAVRVHPQAEVHNGPVSGAPRAWWCVVVDEEYKHGKSTSWRRALTEYYPGLVPVMDESGEGLLEMKGAEVDSRAVGVSLAGFESPNPALAQLLARAQRHPAHRRYMVEEQYLERSESLYLLGKAERRVDPKQTQTYRAASTTAIISGVQHSGLLLHAGSERSILRGLRLESAYAGLLFAATCGLAAVFVALQLFLVSR